MQFGAWQHDAHFVQNRQFLRMLREANDATGIAKIQACTQNDYICC